MREATFYLAKLTLIFLPFLACVIEFSYETAELLGRLNELNLRGNELKSRNMDLWNNSVGRSYGKKFKRGEELFFGFLKALKDGDLIITPDDPRKFKGAKKHQ